MNNKFVFFGTPEVASKTLEILKESGYLPSLIITSPDRPSGRGMKMTSSPTKVFAIENNIPYLTPEKLNDEVYQKLQNENADLFIVVAYGKILPERFINLPKIYTINIHYSLLPKYRGASPVESAILNGEQETGISIQKMAFKMDTGPILLEEKVKIQNDEKTQELRGRLIEIGGKLLAKNLPKIFENALSICEQDEMQASYCNKINKEDGLIDLNGDGVKNYNKFRSYFAWPKTFFFVNDKRVIIKDAKLENGKFIILRVIPEGKKEISYEDFLKSNII
ncbi:MAG: methionyl-tRNA formyltransferase [Candidatus Pacebacteria bacterium]|nr:methionyl-tRNA formyltransferase [Candidatus Paceibacterota bacterium]